MALADETGTIGLDGEKVPVKAFTLDQLQVVMGHFRALDLVLSGFNAETGTGGPLDPEVFGICAKIIALAVGKEPGEIRATFDEAFEAIPRIKEVSGLVPLMARLAAMVATSPGTGSTPTS